MNVAFLSLGCDKNRINTEQMMAACRSAGYTVTGDPDGADVAVLNTCGFIESAKSEAIDQILELGQLKKQGRLGRLLVAGCLPQRYREEIKEELPEVDGMIGTGSFPEVVAAIAELRRGEYPQRFGDIHHTGEEGERLLTTPPWTAYLKIAEGCSNGCAFCAIPRIRGRYRSRPMDEVLAEAEWLAARGAKELILIAQDTARYGTDLEGGATLAALLRELCKLDFHWIRLHYLYPEAITDELIDRIAREPKIVHYLDIPIQHVNDGILKTMRRRSTRAEIEALLAKLRAAIPDVVIRTSLICGLPGEGEAEFEELCGFLREQKLQRVGVFQFSPEEGTLAAAMAHQVDPETAARRVELVVDLQSRIMDEYNEARLGTCMEVLCEGFDPGEGCYVGRTYADSVEIDGRVLFTEKREAVANSGLRLERSEADAAPEGGEGRLAESEVLEPRCEQAQRDTEKRGAVANSGLRLERSEADAAPEGGEGRLAESEVLEPRCEQAQRDTEKREAVAGEVPAGEFVRVRITGAADGDLTGEIERGMRQ